MSVIYEPRGKAKEYSPLALNLYNGCSHGCLYCYAPSACRKKREDFVNATPRKDVIAKLKKDVAKFAGDPRPILLCFTSDPYQPLEAEMKITRQALQILGEAGCSVRVLTKASARVRRDFDLMAKYDVELGITLLFNNDEHRIIWEPSAGTVEARMSMLADAYRAGIRTWISIEPVFYPAQAIDIVRRCSTFTDRYAVGKLNHMPEIECGIDWAEFLRDILPVLVDSGRTYYIKNALWQYATDNVKTKFRKER